MIKISDEKIKEREILLKRYLPHLTWEYRNEVKEKINQEVFNGKLSIEKSIDLRELAQDITDEQLHKMLLLSPYLENYSFRGKYYTVTGGRFEPIGAYEEVKDDTKQFLKEHGKKGYALLKALTELDDAPFTRIAARASEIYGERFYPTTLIAELRDNWDMAREVGSRNYPKWAMPEEIKAAVIEVLTEFEEKPIPKLSTRQAEKEFSEVLKMEEEFKNYLQGLVEERLEETIKFGQKMSPKFLIDYLQDLYGDVLFFDHLLTLVQQYSICDTPVYSEGGYKAFSTGFNLALFGEPGTGKTFATKDMIIGNIEQGVPPHGLPGKNRYCGGMTAAMFISIGEAYTGRRLNFVVTEFNDWFKYKGMVEPLKLAMERGTIIYETKTYSVGPYKFSSFFSVNYNTKTPEKGYKVTISDPNFNAIEDRMLCRLHRLTKKKYAELAKSQRKFMLGITSAKMRETAPFIRDHLTLLYAVQTGEPLVKNLFEKKRIELTEKTLELLDKARELILENIDKEFVPFSMRLEKRALSLASAMSLLNYFKYEDTIPIDPLAIRMAAQFFVEEAWIRAQESFNLYEVLKKI